MRPRFAGEAGLQQPVKTRETVLCVDLDGTLIRTDLLFESLLLVLKKRPWLLLMLPWFLLRGRAALKHALARYAVPNPAYLPYREDLVNWCRKQAEAGIPVYLATGSNEVPAQAVADHLGFFSGVIASSAEHNNKGSAKVSAISSTVDEAPFRYIGDSRADLPVWAAAKEAVLAGKGLRYRDKVTAQTPVAEVFGDEPKNRVKTLLKALRVHQWVKNILVFVPLFTAHIYTQTDKLLAALFAFIAFCLASSSVYVLNDLFDLEADRRHKRKRSRPFAAGDLSIPTGLVLVPLLAGGAVAVSFLLPLDFLPVLVLYLVITLAYSVYLKQKALVDVLTLAGLFTMRIFAGTSALTVELSEWLLAFSMFLFLSLAFVKRYAELHNLRIQGGETTPGRGYRVDDDNQLATFGITAGYMAVLVFALYISSPKVAALYTFPRYLWLICPPMFYWISRIWLVAKRGQMHEDPIIYAFKDKASYAVGVVVIAMVLAAT